MKEESLDLLARMQAGDRDALELLLDRHLPAVRAFVRLRSGRLLRSKEASTDLVQSVCREVLQHMDRFRYPSEAGFRQWLYVTAQRKIQQRYEYYLAQKRDAGREVRQPDTSRSHDELFDCYASFCTPSREVEAREEVERIEAGFDRLSEDHREAILLAHVVGLSRAEIGEHMGRSEGAVRVLLSRALARLMEVLDKG